MRLLGAAAAALAVLPGCGAGPFYAALHSNFVVNLDFEGDAQAPSDGGDGGAAAEEDQGDVKVIAFAGGRTRFKCHLPFGRNHTAGADGSHNASKSRAHFLSAKLAPFRGACWKMQKDYWSYDVCFGRKVVQYRADGDARFSLGEHAEWADELLPSGEASELYTGGTGNRTTQIRYTCGSSEMSSRKFTIKEDQPLLYTVTVSSPSFCSWRDTDGTQVSDSSGRELGVSSLLEELRGHCINVTQGWWTYEYCYPRTLSQFHLQGSNKRQEPEHVLGTLNGSGAATAPNRVEMSMVRLKPSISPHERRAPPSNHFTLRQRLGGGTVCDETKRARTTLVQFQCPSNWQTRPDTRIVSINEAALCEYEMMIHTTLLCGHHKFIPTLPRGKEMINCVIQPQEL